MFTKDQLKALKAKGVEDAVILALMFDEDEARAGAAPDPAPEEPKQAPAPAPEPDPAPAPAAVVGADQILAAIERLTGAVQAANIRNMTGADPKHETADDVLAAVINPKKGEK